MLVKDELVLRVVRGVGVRVRSMQDAGHKRNFLSQNFCAWHGVWGQFRFL